VTSSILKQFEPIFYPKSLAIIGASNDPAKFGNIIFRSLLDMGFNGRIYPVNPAGQEINVLKVYSSIKAIPDEVNCAIITIPAPLVLNALKECMQKGVKGVEILKSGFKETGSPEGQRMEDEISNLARQGLRIIGPNCFGIYCPESGLTILPGQNFLRESGPVGFLAQSGGLCADFGQIAQGLGIRFSKMVSYGNGCDVNACDLLEYYFADPKTEIIGGYIEGVNDSARFLRILKENKGQKPVILWKAGLTSAGSQAVMSHTGSLSGAEKVWTGALRQAGVIQVESAEELIDTIYTFLYLPPETGPRVAVMGGGGAISVAASDTLERLGLAIPPFSPEIFQKLKASFPPVGNSLRNPVDLGNPMIPPSMLKIVMEAAGQDEGIDTLIIIQILFYILFQLRHRLKMDDRPLRQFSFQPELLKACQEVKTKYKKPIILVLPDITTEASMIDLEVEWRRERDNYQQAGFPVFKTLDRAARALRNFIAFYKTKFLLEDLK